VIKRKQLFVVLGVVLSIAIVAGGLFLWRYKITSKISEVPQIDFKKDQISAIDDRLSISSQISDLDTKALYLTNISQSYYMKQLYVQALNTAKEADSLGSKDKDTQNLVSLTLANAYAGTGDFVKASELIQTVQQGLSVEDAQLLATTKLIAESYSKNQLFVSTNGRDECAAGVEGACKK
jgi:hypothetical protein